MITFGIIYFFYETWYHKKDSKLKKNYYCVVRGVIHLFGEWKQNLSLIVSFPAFIVSFVKSFPKKTPTKVEVKNVGAKGFEPLTPWV